MATPEQDLKFDIKGLLDYRGAFWSAVKGGPHSKPGDPDIIACYRGFFIGIEAKTDTGKLSGWQEMRRDQIVKADGIWVLARCKEDVEEVLDDIDESLADAGATIEVARGAGWDA